MSGWSGGVYTRFRNWVTDKANSVNPQAALFDQEDDGFAAGLNNCITKDGLNKPSAAMDWNGQSLTGILNLANTGTISFAGGKITAAVTGNLGIVPSNTGSGLDLSNNNTAVANPSLRLINGNASAQTMIDWFTNGVISGRFRNDFSGSMAYASYSSGVHAFFVGGDSGVGTNTFQVVSQANGGATVVDPGGAQQIVGYRRLPMNIQSGNYTLVAADSGKCIQMTGTANPNTLTVPSAVFSAGDVVVVMCISSTNTFTIAQGGGMTMFFAGAGVTSGNRTVTSVGLITLTFQTASACVVSGAGLT